MSPSEQLFTSSTKVVKPSLDDRQYQFIKLKANNLTALVISDPKAEKAAAALDVNVGHLSDPAKVPGLAHFLEHLLFMGTQKYPKENEYSQYLSEHGGYSNAFTSKGKKEKNTNYYFEVTSDHLEGALDRFAQFFVAPLFDDSCTEREMNAVDSEHKKNLQSDMWRLHQLEKDLSNPNHPFSKFGTGNIETLKHAPKKMGIDIRSVLLDFHCKYYSSNISKLVVLGKEPIDVLSNWVAEKFTPMKDKQIAAPEFQGHPLTAAELQNVIKVKPVKNMRSLIVTFPFPDYNPYYMAQPQRYLSHLIGHESEGSVLSLLKRKGWANRLTSGAHEGGKNFAFYKVSIDLTEEGLANYESVVEIMFQYIKMMKEAGVQKWIFDDCKSLEEMSFKFKEKTPPADYACDLAQRMHIYADEHVLSGPYLMYDFKPDLINSYMDQLSPEKFKLTLVSQSFEANEKWKRAQWYGTEYIVEPLSDELKNRLSKLEKIPELHLPSRNEFIPEDFTVPENMNLPPIPNAVILQDDSLIRLWHKRDDSFFVPKTNVWFMIRTPSAYVSPASCIKGKMLTELLKDDLNELSYYADCAGLSYDFDNNTEGFVLVLGGYSHKLPVLLKKIMEKLINFKISPNRFEIIKEQQLRRYKNWNLESPHSHAIYYVNYATQSVLWHPDEKIAELEGLTVKDLNSFQSDIFSHLFVESLVHGNMESKEAIAMGQIVVSSLSPKPLSPFQRFQTVRAHLLTPNTQTIFEEETRNPENLNSAIEYFLQVGEYGSIKQRATLSLFATIFQEPCFDQLRTKEQLGYMVFSGARRQNAVEGYRVIVQSERHPLYLESRIEAFLANMKTILSEMSEEEFAKFRTSLIAQFLEKFKNLDQESRTLKAQVDSHRYDFKCNQILAEEVKLLTKTDIITFYESYIAVSAPGRRKFSSWITSSKIKTVDEMDTVGWALANAPQDADVAALKPILQEIFSRNKMISLSDLPDFKSGLNLAKSASPVEDWKSYYALAAKL